MYKRLEWLNVCKKLIEPVKIMDNRSWRKMGIFNVSKRQFWSGFPMVFPQNYIVAFTLVFQWRTQKF